jgi:hypothetical protein
VCSYDADRNLCIDGGYEICAEMYNKNILVPLQTFVPKVRRGPFLLVFPKIHVCLDIGYAVSVFGIAQDGA